MYLKHKLLNKPLLQHFFFNLVKKYLYNLTLLPSHGDDNNFISKLLRFPELIIVTLLFLCPSHDGRVEENNIKFVFYLY